MFPHVNNVPFDYYWSLCVAGILISWFVASVIHQFRFRWWEFISRFDLFNLLPRWTFFAPNPGRSDIHVVYRSWIAANPGPWTEIMTTKINNWRWIWNPSRYSNKGLSDLVNSLCATIQANKDFPRSVILSGPYISMLYLVMDQPSANMDITHRQFAIVATKSFDENRALEIKYISEVHRAQP